MSQIEKKLFLNSKYVTNLLMFIVFSLVLGIPLFISYHCILLSVNLFCYLKADCTCSRYMYKTMGFTSTQHY